MANILIVPPKIPEAIDSIVDLSQEIQKSYADSYISTLVTLDTYDNYYKSENIKGLIIKPRTFWDKLCLFELNQFDVAIIFEEKFVWSLACKRAKIDNTIFVSNKFTQKEKNRIIKKLLKMIVK